MATTMRSLARRKLLKEFDVESAIRLNDTGLNSPTLATPTASSSTDLAKSRSVFARRASIVNGTSRPERLHWAARAILCVAKLGKLIVRIKTAFSTSGLDLASFDFDVDPAKEGPSLRSAAVATGDDPESKELL
ncbi:hypothetical protein CYMTET_28646 [Cymbomonas tetramitiformis]|uniref:Uncharacterized protein n=1 Tax=Cymbomonas tetramitiformis TaxID=36881 RepID=A0AAE0KVP6_9CHLO|nr:hypothetical protein CYMTET_28646 [Cymbomonas tetramitiformis]